MSLEFIEVFFPTTSYILKNKYKNMLDYVFPPALQSHCHRPEFELKLGWRGRDTPTIPIAWPTLLPVMLCGILIGVVGHVKLRPSPYSRSSPRTPSWSLAMAFYAIMNFAAVLCHSFVPRDSPWQSPLVCMDIAATGCCCFSAVYAVISRELGAVRHRHKDGDDTVKRHVANLLLGNGILNMSAFTLTHYDFIPEFLYIGMALIAAVVIGLHVLLRPPVGHQRRYVGMLFAGGAMAVSGIPLDRHLCRYYLGPHINHVFVLFVGCHVIMLSLYLYVWEELAVMRASIVKSRQKAQAERAAAEAVAAEADNTHIMAPTEVETAVSTMEGHSTPSRYSTRSRLSSITKDSGFTKDSGLTKDSALSHNSALSQDSGASNDANPSEGKCRSRMRRKA